MIGTPTSRAEDIMYFFYLYIECVRPIRESVAINFFQCDSVGFNLNIGQYFPHLCTSLYATQNF